MSPDRASDPGDRLWLYFGSDTFYLDEVADLILIGAVSWGNYDMIAPGDVNADGRVDLLPDRSQTEDSVSTPEPDRPAKVSATPLLIFKPPVGTKTPTR
ncbi:hypothetical protein [Streptomyces sp. LN549]|uniref:hypothetical protein n=1 Tax=Streptomyces sp. LN549 TaxID=3112979 RepID=UPI003716C2CD